MKLSFEFGALLLVAVSVAGLASDSSLWSMMNFRFPSVLTLCLEEESDCIVRIVMDVEGVSVVVVSVLVVVVLIVGFLTAVGLINRSSLLSFPTSPTSCTPLMGVSSSGSPTLTSIGLVALVAEGH